MIHELLHCFAFVFESASNSFDKACMSHAEGQIDVVTDLSSLCTSATVPFMIFGEKAIDELVFFVWSVNWYVLCIANGSGA